MCSCVCWWGNTSFRAQFFAPTRLPDFWLSDGHFSWSNYCISRSLGWQSFGRKLRNIFTAGLDSINICLFSPLEKLWGRWISWWGRQKTLEMVESVDHLASSSTWLCSLPQSILTQQSLGTFFFGIHEQIWGVPWQCAPWKALHKLIWKGFASFLIYRLILATFLCVSVFWLLQVSFYEGLYLASKVGVISPDCGHLQCSHGHLSQLFWTHFRVTRGKQILLGYDSSDIVGLIEIVPVSLDWLKMH